jgi:hypothetical protein
MNQYYLVTINVNDILAHIPNEKPVVRIHIVPYLIARP